MRRKWLDQVLKINKELLLIFSIMTFAAVINFFVAGQKLVLSFYDLPTLFAAYYFGRARAVQTAFASVLIICWINLMHPIAPASGTNFAARQLLGWSDVAVWGSFLLITAYAMGTLYARSERHRIELRETQLGVLEVLCGVVSNDPHARSHAYRTSVYAARIAGKMGLPLERIEDIRNAALLQGIGEFEAGRQVLEWTAKLSDDEIDGIESQRKRGTEKRKLGGRALRRVLAIVIEHQVRSVSIGSEAPDAPPLSQESRIIRAAEKFDSLVNDELDHNAISELEAFQVIAQGIGRDFDPEVVSAFESVLRSGRLELSEVLD